MLQRREGSGRSISDLSREERKSVQQQSIVVVGMSLRFSAFNHLIIRRHDDDSTCFLSLSFALAL